MKLDLNSYVALHSQSICVLVYDPDSLLNYILNRSLSYFIMSLYKFSTQAILIFLVE